MAGRFGRNQRRRAREEIARLTAEVERQKAVADVFMRHADERALELRMERDRMHRFFKDVADVLGKEFVGLPGMPPLLKEMVVPKGERTFRVLSGGRLFFSGCSPADEIQLQCEIMHVLKVDLIAEDFRRKIHVMVSLGDECRSAYAISESTLRTASREFIMSKLAIPIATRIADQVCEGRY